MYCARDKIYYFAIISRLTILLLQFVFNLICPDHKADAFESPIDPRAQVGFCDKLVNLLFEGLTRWDGQYFLHIAKYGYTYENTIAFYPLLPLITRVFANVLKLPLFFLNHDSIILLSAVLLNIVCFVKSALVLYDLSKLVLKDIRLAYRASILYCINPASIFFSAVYSESMFAFVTFYTMITALENNSFVFLPLSMSFITRSNGLTNIGYPLFGWLKDVVNRTFCSTTPSVAGFIKNVFSTVVPVLINLVLAFIPLTLLQINNFNSFCVTQNASVPLHVAHHAITNGYPLVGQEGYQPPWCSQSIPMAYTYVQTKYWNVGFLNYYEAKQVPNFLLALPILFIMLACVLNFVLEHWRTPVKALVCSKFDGGNRVYPADMFPFVVHGLILTIFSILFVHIQVSTRFLASNSPLMYWYCAILMTKGEKKIEDVTEISYEDQENLDSRVSVFFMTKRRYNLEDKFVLVYFFGYIFVGCFMFSNFLPWT